MKNWSFFLLFSIVSFPVFSQQSGDMVVKINGIPSDQGQLRAALFDSPEGFPDKVENSHQQSSVVVTGDSSTIVFSDIPYGEYVIAVFHDENNNGTLDTNARGIPLEALGVSGKAQMKLGPPKYENAAFEFAENQSEVEIYLKQFKASAEK